VRAQLAAAMGKVEAAAVETEIERGRTKAEQDRCAVLATEVQGLQQQLQAAAATVEAAAVCIYIHVYMYAYVTLFLFLYLYI